MALVVRSSVSRPALLQVLPPRWTGVALLLALLLVARQALGSVQLRRLPGRRRLGRVRAAGAAGRRGGTDGVAVEELAAQPAQVHGVPRRRPRQDPEPRRRHDWLLEHHGLRRVDHHRPAPARGRHRGGPIGGYQRAPLPRRGAGQQRHRDGSALERERSREDPGHHLLPPPHGPPRRPGGRDRRPRHRRPVELGPDGAGGPHPVGEVGRPQRRPPLNSIDFFPPY